MQFNRIASKILHLYKYAVDNTKLKLTKKDIQNAFHAVNLRLQGEPITEEQEKAIRKFDRVKQFDGIDEYIKEIESISNDSSISNDVEKEIRSNDPLADYKIELIKNTLFPGHIYSQSTKNYFSRKLIDEEITKEKQYIDDNEEEYDTVISRLDYVDQILLESKKIDNTISELWNEKDKKNEQLAQLKEKIINDNNRKNEAEDQLYTVYGKEDQNGQFISVAEDENGDLTSVAAEDDSAFTNIDYANYLFDRYPDIDKVYEALINYKKDAQTYQELKQAYDAKQAEYTKMLITDRGSKSLDDVKQELQELRTILNKRKKYLATVLNITKTGYGDGRNALIPEHLNSAFKWKNVLTYQDIVENYRFIRDQFKSDSILTQLGQAEVSMNSEGELVFDPRTGKIEASYDQDDNGDLATAIKQYNTTINQINELNNKIQAVKKKKDKYNENQLSIANTDDYKVLHFFANEFERHNRYYMQLLRYKRAMLINHKSDENYDEQEQANKLSDQLNMINQQLSDLRDANIAAKRKVSTTRELEDSIVINKYQNLQNKRRVLQNALKNINRTLSQKLSGADVQTINTQQVKEGIAKEMESQIKKHKSLLGILLSQSIDKFVMRYLQNNKYQTPDVRNKIRSLIHYYLPQEMSQKDKDGNEIPISETLKNIQKSDRLVPQEEFIDNKKNIQLLTEIVTPLLKTKKSNLFQMFLSILQRKYPNIYMALALPSPTGKFYFVVSKNDESNRSDAFDSITKLKERFNLPSDFKCEDGSEFTLEGEDVVIRHDYAAGNELMDFCDTQQNQEIMQMYKEVEDLFTNYVRERLQRASYEICSNVGKNFYGVTLASSLSINISNYITQDNLGDYIGIKDKNKKSDDASSKAAIANTNINELKNEIIAALCKKFDVNSADQDSAIYEVIAKFLIKNKVNDPQLYQRSEEKNSSYRARLKSYLESTRQIFDRELTRIIERRINLCSYELEARDKIAYNNLMNAAFDRSAYDEQYMKRLNGFRAEDGTLHPGLVDECNALNMELNEIQNNMKEILLKKFNDDSSVVNNLLNEIINNIKSDDFEKYIRKIKSIKDNIRKEAKTQHRNVSPEEEDYINDIQVQVEAIEEMQAQQLDQKYYKKYEEYQAKAAETQRIKDYVESTSTREEKKESDTNIRELEKKYTELYGQNYNPIVRLRKLLPKKKELAKLELELQELKLNHKQKDYDRTKKIYDQKYGEIADVENTIIRNFDLDGYKNKILSILKGDRQNSIALEKMRSYKSYGAYGQLMFNVFKLGVFQNEEANPEKITKAKHEVDDAQTTINMLQQRIKDLEDKIYNTYSNFEDESEDYVDANVSSFRENVLDIVNQRFQKQSDEQMFKSFNEALEKVQNEKKMEEAERLKAIEQDSDRFGGGRSRRIQDFIDKNVNSDEANYDLDNFMNQLANPLDDAEEESMSYEIRLNNEDDINEARAKNQVLDSNVDLIDRDQWIKVSLVNPTQLNESPTVEEQEDWLKNHLFDERKEFDNWIKAFVHSNRFLPDRSVVESNIKLRAWIKQLRESFDDRMYAFYGIPTVEQLRRWLDSHPNFVKKLESNETSNTFKTKAKKVKTRNGINLSSIDSIMKVLLVNSDQLEKKDWPSNDQVMEWRKKNNFDEKEERNKWIESFFISNPPMKSMFRSNNVAAIQKWYKETIASYRNSTYKIYGVPSINIIFDWLKSHINTFNTWAPETNSNSTERHTTKSGLDISFDEWIQIGIINPSELIIKPTRDQQRAWYSVNKNHFNPTQTRENWILSFLRSNPLNIEDMQRMVYKDEEIEKWISQTRKLFTNENYKMYGAPSVRLIDSKLQQEIRLWKSPRSDKPKSSAETEEGRIIYKKPEKKEDTKEDLQMKELFSNSSQNLSELLQDKNNREWLENHPNFETWVKFYVDQLPSFTKDEINSIVNHTNDTAARKFNTQYNTFNFNRNDNFIKRKPLKKHIVEYFKKHIKTYQFTPEDNQLMTKDNHQLDRDTYMQIALINPNNLLSQPSLVEKAKWYSENKYNFNVNNVYDKWLESFAKTAPITLSQSKSAKEVEEWINKTKPLYNNMLYSMYGIPNYKQMLAWFRDHRDTFNFANE